MGMRRCLSLLAATALVVLLASGGALFAVEEPVQAAFPGENGDIVYSCGNFPYKICTIPHDGGTTTLLTASQQGSQENPVYSPDGKTIAYDNTTYPGSSNYEIYTILTRFPQVGVRLRK